MYLLLSPFLPKKGGFTGHLPRIIPKKKNRSTEIVYILYLKSPHG